MPSPPFGDKYHLRHVSSSASKACFICYKPTTAVLITEDGRSDFFYICEAHLQDTSFALPDVDPELENTKQKQQKLQAEIEVVKKQWELYQSKKKKKDSKKDEDEDKDKDKGKDKDDEKSTDGDKDTSPKHKLDALEKQKSQTDDTIASAKTRKFTLNKDIYRLRLQSWKAAQAAKQTRQLLQKPTLFPSVPKGIPGKSSTSGSPGSPRSPSAGTDTGTTLPKPDS